MDTETKQKLSKSLYSVGLLKNHSTATEYGRGSADMAQLFLSIITSRKNSIEFRTAMENLKSKGKSADITLGRA